MSGCNVYGWFLLHQAHYYVMHLIKNVSTQTNELQQYGFNPGAEHDEKIAAAKDRKASAGADDVHKQSLFRKAADLFARVPVLKALFIEILASQGVSTILNVAYVTKLSSVIPDDKERAGWSGKVSSDIMRCYLLVSWKHMLRSHIYYRLHSTLISFFGVHCVFHPRIVLCHYQRRIGIPSIRGTAAGDANHRAQHPLAHRPGDRYGICVQHELRQGSVAVSDCRYLPHDEGARILGPTNAG